MSPIFPRTVESTSTQLPIITPIVSATETPDVMTTQSTSPAPDIISPVIERFCPEQRVVPFSELGLNDSTRLILREADVHHAENDVFIWTLSVTQTQPVTVPNIVPGARIFSDNILFSPNGELFLYRGPGYTTGGDEWLYDFWISSIDGYRQWKLASNIDAYTNPKWISNEEIEFWRASRPYVNCSTLEFTINPYTLVIKDAPNLPDLFGEYCAYPGWILSPDRSQALYPINGNIFNSQWVINDLNSGHHNTVFPWLNVIDLYEPFRMHIRWTESGFDFVFLQPYGFDLLMDLPVSAVEDSEVPWEKYSLPREILNYHLNWWSTDNRYFSFDMVDEGVDQLEMAGESQPSHFYLFDAQTRILRDYCLDRGRFGEISGQAGMPKVSLDGRYMAWGIYETPNSRRYPYGIEILDLETGRMAELNLGTLDLLGWGEVSDNYVP
jgi:hypothetical protein